MQFAMMLFSTIFVIGRSGFLLYGIIWKLILEIFRIKFHIHLVCVYIAWRLLYAVFMSHNFCGVLIAFAASICWNYRMQHLSSTDSILVYASLELNGKILPTFFFNFFLLLSFFHFFFFFSPFWEVYSTTLWTDFHQIQCVRYVINKYWLNNRE